VISSLGISKQFVAVGTEVSVSRRPQSTGEQMMTECGNPLIITRMRERGKQHQIELTDLENGPILHPVLSDDLLQRIKAFKQILVDVDNTTLDEVIGDFKRDVHPEQEIAVWERIAATYTMFLSHNPTDDLATKHDVYSVLLIASLGMEDWTEIRHLTRDQVKHLVLNFTGL
jgi:hypothetical protein